ncbi:MAG: hypothetical protein CSA84_01225 [Actinomycetales bacterium]|nr:MAG: hypothetical protein CSA84_01225 [Actinomycetales bacterium]
MSKQKTEAGLRGVVALLVSLGLAACAGSVSANAPATHSTTTEAADAAPLPSEVTATTTSLAPPSPTTHPLPRGGTVVFPEHRLVGYAGLPGAPSMGRLGIGDLDERVTEIEQLGLEYAGSRTPLPVLELIATVVHRRPGKDGLFRSRIDEAIVQRHLEAARRRQGILLLNIQPGRAAFLDEVKAWERWLREPDVGLALDPEWAVKAGQIPGRVYGSTTGAELDEIAAWVSDLVATHQLPEKVLLYHQLHTSIVRNPEQLRPHPGVTLIVSVDGIGSPGAKTATWNRVVAVTPPHVHKGFKLFFEEDRRHGPLMTPEQVLALTPRPEYVLYE